MITFSEHSPNTPHHSFTFESGDWYIEVRPKQRGINLFWEWLLTLDSGLIAEGANTDPEVAKQHAGIAYEAFSSRL